MFYCWFKICNCQTSNSSIWWTVSVITCFCKGVETAGFINVSVYLDSTFCSVALCVATCTDWILQLLSYFSHYFKNEIFLLSVLLVDESEPCCNVAPCCCAAEKPGAAPAPAEAPAAAPTKKLENLFFIEEPKTAHVTESETHKQHHMYTTHTQHNTYTTQHLHNTYTTNHNNPP